METAKMTLKRIIGEVATMVVVSNALSFASSKVVLLYDYALSNRVSIKLVGVSMFAFIFRERAFSLEGADSG